VTRARLPSSDELDGPRAASSLRARASSLTSPAVQLARLDAVVSRSFHAQLEASGLSPLTASAPRILQLNLGRLCNMTCRHCHVDAGPDRTAENMSRETMVAALALLDRVDTIDTVDLTGGAPELNPHFRWLLDELATRRVQILDRCNLTVLLLPRNADLPERFAALGVEVVASLPHWRKPNTDRQRGDGTWERSLVALRRLNEVGYGAGDPRRRLTLVHNPAGAFLPSGQASMEKEWRAGLLREHGLRFDRLIALNNMPVARFLESLEESGNTARYLELLTQAFNPAAAAGLMCRDTLSVSWDGQLFDCDFNQMLDLPISGPATHLDALVGPGPAPIDRLLGRPIVTAAHCFGCTAGAGSSCGGATAA
jgi:radical SAM/Cys-rich protein